MNRLQPVSYPSSTPSFRNRALDLRSPVYRYLSFNQRQEAKQTRIVALIRAADELTN
jgi:hypothetical protein